MKLLRKLALTCIPAALLLAGCMPTTPAPTLAPEATAPETAAPATAAPVETEAMAPTSTPAGGAEAVEYNLGEATLTQSMFPEDSRFRNMPVRLNGMIAVPEAGGAAPVVIILHGTHPGCPIPEGGEIDLWPCDPEVEQKNYRGFSYLVSRLAEEGYVALSINVNAENTFGFGEPFPGERLEQLVDLHLKALAEAASGGENNFGVELAGRADVSRLALFGHSRGAEGALWMTNSKALHAADAAERLGYGPVHGILMLAPATIQAGAVPAQVPLAAIQSACDGDVLHQDGQLFYEIARMKPDHQPWAVSVWLEGANHNGFNDILGSDMMVARDRPDCDPLLDPAAQRTFLEEFSLTFLSAIFGEEDAATQALVNLGLDFQAPSPDTILDQPARVSALAPWVDRLPIMRPVEESELQTNLAGGTVAAEGVTTFFCRAGYFTPWEEPGSEPCKRMNISIPGNPAMLVLSWEQNGGALRFGFPQATDLAQFAALSLRAAVDPSSGLNTPEMPQSFSIRLTDQQGGVAVVQTALTEPALQFPVGVLEETDWMEGGLFSGRVPLTTLRIPLANFSGVDLATITEIALVFDQNDHGTIFVADVELVR